MIVFKTTSEHVQAVWKNLMYASDDVPAALKEGDDVLIQVTYLSDRQGPPKIRYRWKHKAAYLDPGGVCKRLWDYQWRYILEGKNGCRLKRPFDIRDVQVTSKDYGAAQRYVYVEPPDEEEIRKRGLLDCW